MCGIYINNLIHSSRNPGGSAEGLKRTNDEWSIPRPRKSCYCLCPREWGKPERQN